MKKTYFLSSFFIILLTLPGVSFGNDKATQTKSFSAFIQEIHAEALQKGIKRETLDRVLTNLEPFQRAITHDRNQAEVKDSILAYKNRRVTPALIAEGKNKLLEHKELLDAVYKKYGVPPRFIVAFWGVESRYGKHTGTYNIIQSLATLAWDPRRSSFFKKQLFHALTILDKGYIEFEKFKGSWAGEVGDMQFIPGSYLTWAIDANNDGRRDLWDTHEDIFASAGNYLQDNGWKRNTTWGRMVRVPKGIDISKFSREIETSLSEYQAMGIRRMTGADLPNVDIKAGLLFPDENDPTIAFLIYHNFKVILRWNRSLSYAVTIGSLADALR